MIVWNRDALFVVVIQDVVVVERAETKLSDQVNKSYDAEIESFQLLAGDSDAKSLGALIGQITNGNSEDSISPIVLSANSDKSHRTVSLLGLNLLC